MTKKESIALKKAFVAEVWAKNGVTRGVVVDPREYPPIEGMEGPMVVKEYASRVMYWDPKEGAYYDRKTDFYTTSGYFG